MLIDELIISEDTSVLQALNTLEKTGRKILFIAPCYKLSAVLTDGEIRRHILKNKSLDMPVKDVANYNFKSLPLSKKANAIDFMMAQSISAVPILDSDEKIVDVVFLDDVLSIEPRKVLNVPVVIMAGGLGTRLYPYTKILPKPLIPIGEKPIVEHIIDKFYSFGCNDFNLIVNHKKNMIKAYFNELNTPYNIHFKDEEVFLGTGGGLSLLKEEIHTPFFLTNCDVIIQADYQDIYKFHKNNNNVITVVCALKNVTIPYGVFSLNEDGEIDTITEKPTMSFLTNTGMYLVNEAVIQSLEENKAISFPEIIDIYRQRGEKIGVYPISEDSWMDMGQLEELEEMRRKLEQ